MLAMYNDCSGFGGLACSLRVIVVHQFGLDRFAYVCDMLGDLKPAAHWNESATSAQSRQCCALSGH